MKYIKRKSITKPLNGNIIDSINTENETLNTYSIRILKELINPIGSGMDYYGTEAPTNYMFADGTAISRIEYSELFSVIGTTYGAGDGSTTFNLPDKRERVTAMYCKGS